MEDYTELAITTILDMAEHLYCHGAMLNERYLHHAFSRRLQAQGDLLGLTHGPDKPRLHPEWPTCKKSTGINDGGLYRRIDGHYQPCDDGGPGWIDFALGDYHRPSVGIEFTLHAGFSREEITYDLVKLLDGRNPFTTVIDWNVIVRKRLPGAAAAETVRKYLSATSAEARKRLGPNYCGDGRRRLFLLTELDKQERRHWHCASPDGLWVAGLPPAGSIGA
jgi:hypothetical protein